MAVVVDAATYDVVEQDARALGIADAPADGPGSKVTIVYKRVGSRWKPWVAGAITRALRARRAWLVRRMTRRGGPRRVPRREAAAPW